MKCNLVFPIFLFTSLALGLSSCKKDETDTRSCSQLAEGGWRLVTKDSIPITGFQLTFDLKSNGNGEIVVTDDIGVEHIRPVENWVISPDCSLLSFTYFINGFAHPIDLNIKQVNDDEFVVVGDLLGLFENDTVLGFRRR